MSELPIAAKKAKIVFLVGAYRSGTTLLRELLNSHPDIAITPELRFFDLTMSNVKKGEPDGNFLDRIQAKVNPSDPRWYPVDLMTIPEHVGRHKTYRDYFLALADYTASKKPYKILIEKTPENIYYTEEIKKILPEAKFICITRDGREMCASASKAWGKENFVLMVAKWVLAVQELPNIARLDHHFVRYEDIISQPEKYLKDVFNYLGFEYHEEYSENLKKFSNSFFNGPQSNVSRFGTIFNEEEQMLLEGLMSPQLLKSGYKLKFAKHNIPFNIRLKFWYYYFKEKIVMSLRRRNSAKYYFFLKNLLNKARFLKKWFKTEFFFLSEMIRRRYGPVFYWKYFKNRCFGLKMLKEAPVIKYEPEDDFEIHVLSQKSGLWRLYWTLRSLLYYSGLKPKLIMVHNDGSIDEATVRLMEGKFPNLKVISKLEANNTINKLDILEKIKGYRYGKNFFIISLTDPYLLSKASKVIVLDNDILFFNKPIEIIDFIKNGKPDALMMAGFAEHPINVDKEYEEKYKLIERGARLTNSGILMYKREKFTLDMFYEYFEHTLDPENSHIEQAGWSSMMAQVDYQMLSRDTYIIKGPVVKDTIMKHYTNPRRYELYGQGIDELKKRI